MTVGSAGRNLWPGLSHEQELTIALTDVSGFDSPGLFAPAASCFYLRSSNTSGTADYAFGYGVPDGGGTVIEGDWDGDGRTGVGLYDPQTSTFYLTNALTTGTADDTVEFGPARSGWQPLVGCWGDAPVENEAETTNPTALQPLCAAAVDLLLS